MYTPYTLWSKFLQYMSSVVLAVVSIARTFKQLLRYPFYFLYCLSSSRT